MNKEAGKAKPVHHRNPHSGSDGMGVLRERDAKVQGIYGKDYKKGYG